MSGDWEKLVKEHGVEGAKEIMRVRRGLVKNPGFKSMDKDKLKEIAKNAAKKRWGTTQESSE